MTTDDTSAREHTGSVDDKHVTENIQSPAVLKTFDEAQSQGQAEAQSGQQTGRSDAKYVNDVQSFYDSLSDYNVKSFKKYAKSGIDAADREKSMLQARRASENRRMQSRMMLMSACVGNGLSTYTIGLLFGMAVGTMLTGGFGPKVGKDGLTAKERAAKRAGESFEKSESKAMKRAGYAKGLGLRPEESSGLMLKRMRRNLAFGRANLHVPVSGEELGTAYLGIMRQSLDALYEHPEQVMSIRNEANANIALVYELGAANGISASDVDKAARRIASQFDQYPDIEIGFGRHKNISSGLMFDSFQTFVDGGDVHAIDAQIANTQLRMSHRTAGNGLSQYNIEDVVEKVASRMAKENAAREAAAHKDSDANVEDAEFEEVIEDNDANVEVEAAVSDAVHAANMSEAEEEMLMEEILASIELDRKRLENLPAERREAFRKFTSQVETETIRLVDKLKQNPFVGNNPMSLEGALNFQSAALAGFGMGMGGVSEGDALLSVPPELHNDVRNLATGINRLHETFNRSGDAAFGDEIDILVYDTVTETMGTCVFSDVTNCVMDAYSEVDSGAYPVSDPRAHFSFMMDNFSDVVISEKMAAGEDASRCAEIESMACDALREAMCYDGSNCRYSMVGRDRTNVLDEDGNLTFAGKLSMICDGLRFDGKRICGMGGFNGATHDFQQERAFMGACVAQSIPYWSDSEFHAGIDFFDSSRGDNPDFMVLEKAIDDIRKGAVNGTNVPEDIIEVFGKAAKEECARGNALVRDIRIGTDPQGRVSIIDFVDADAEAAIESGSMPYQYVWAGAGPHYVDERLSERAKEYSGKDMSYIGDVSVASVMAEKENSRTLG